jgi:dUTPase
MFKSINDGKLPKAQTKYSAGYDVFANKDVIIGANETELIPLGIKIDETFLKIKSLRGGYFNDIEIASKYFKDDFSKLIERVGVDEEFQIEFATVDKIFEEITPLPHCKIEYNKKDYEALIKGYYLGLYLRSSLGKKGLILPNGVGIIDIDYQDEIMMMIYNGTDNKYLVQKGDRIGQIIIHKHYGFDLLGSNFREYADRNGGFGSTNTI